MTLFGGARAFNNLVAGIEDDGRICVVGPDFKGGLKAWTKGLQVGII